MHHVEIYYQIPFSKVLFSCLLTFFDGTKLFANSMENFIIFRPLKSQIVILTYSFAVCLPLEYFLFSCGWLTPLSFCQRLFAWSKYTIGGEKTVNVVFQFLSKSLSPYLQTFLWAQESIPNLAGRYDNPIRRTGPPGYIGWWNRFLGIDSWAPLQLRALLWKGGGGIGGVSPPPHSPAPTLVPSWSVDTSF